MLPIILSSRTLAPGPRVLTSAGDSQAPLCSTLRRSSTFGAVAMDSLSVLFSADQIHARVEALAREIEAAHPPDQTIHIVGVLRGGFAFTTDLVRALRRPTTVDFARISSYGDATQSSGHLTWHLTPDDVGGRHVLIVEDIVDSGRTLDGLRRHLSAQRPSTLRTVTFLDKPGRRQRSVPIDFVGFTVEDPEVFVVGYGLDLDQRYRELPYIARQVS